MTHRSVRALGATAAIAAGSLLLAGCGPSGGGEAAQAEAARLIAELPAPYNTADFRRGQQLFTYCSACHSLQEGGPNMVGPNLHGVFGRKAAAKPDFAYSEPLKRTGWTWDAALIDKWLANPTTFLPGTKMVFLGVKDPQQRIDLIGYVKVATSGGPR